MLDAGIGPFAVGWVDLAFGADAPDRVVEEVAVLAVHEVDVPRVRGGDHRLAHRHRLRHRKTEPLGSVQGDVAVTPRHQTAELLAAQRAIHDVDIPTSMSRP